MRHLPTGGCAPGYYLSPFQGESARDKESLQRQIDATDRQIDRLVYELYGLTDEEIRIVEEGTR